MGVVFARADRGPLSPRILRHEYIHVLQQRELLFLPFFVIYFLEWLFRLAYCRRPMRAYFSLSMEREAYLNDDDPDYPEKRKMFAWTRFIRNS